MEEPAALEEESAVEGRAGDARRRPHDGQGGGVLENNDVGAAGRRRAR